MSLIQTAGNYLRMIKFSHSVFALPFAFTAALIAAEGVPSVRSILWIAVAMIGGRSGAMGMNRIADRKIDAANPRTRDRELPRGAISTTQAMAFTVFSFGLLIFAAYMLNPLCFRLAPFVIVVLAAYSYTKRITWLCHLFLGMALALAPLGAWIAVRGSFDIEILPLSVAVMFWVAGFDCLYGLQDLEFDRREGIFSIPARFGISRTLWISRTFHLTTVLLLLLLIPIFRLGGLYFTGILLASGLLLYEHTLVRPHDLSRLNMAFFNMNGYISITVFLFTLVNYAAL